MSQKTVLSGPSKAIKITRDQENGTTQVRLNADFFKQQGVTFDDYQLNPVVLEIYNTDDRTVEVD